MKGIIIMSNKKLVKESVKKSAKQKVNPLSIIAMAVVVLAVVVVFIIPKKDQTDLSSTESTKEIESTTENTVAGDRTVPATYNDNGDVVIQIADITENATFYDIESNGTSMGLFAVKAADGTIRTAFNTCQVCNGSPYAFFTQDGDTFQCQNCGNIYGVDMIEQERGGCNPVPITADEKTVTDTEILVPAKLVEENSVRFNNWKQF